MVTLKFQSIQETGLKGTVDTKITMKKGNYSISGKVQSIKKYANGDIDVIFLHDNGEKSDFSSSESSECYISKELVRTLAVSRDENITIFFENDIAVSVEVHFRV